MKIKTNLLFTALLFVALSCNSSKGVAENDDKKENTSPVAEKTEKISLENTQWKLIEVMGKPVKDYGRQMKEPVFVFESAESRFHGNAGCNGMGGTYKLLDGNRIEFSQVISTQMACENMELEDIVSRMIPTLDNYVINDTGELVITKARMAPVLRFERIRNN